MVREMASDCPNQVLMMMHPDRRKRRERFKSQQKGFPPCQAQPNPRQTHLSKPFTSNPTTMIPTRNKWISKAVLA